MAVVSPGYISAVKENGQWVKKPIPPSYKPATPSYPSYSNSNSGSSKSSSGSKTGGSIPPIKPTYQEQSTTNYGSGALGNILSSKKYYDQGVANNNAGLKGWASNNANQHYSQLSPDVAAQVKGMNTQQLIDYINKQNQPKSGETTVTPSPQPSRPSPSIPPSYPSGASSSPQFSAPSKGSVPQIPQTTPLNPARDAAAIEKYVNEQIAAELARQKSAAEQAINAGRTTANQQTGALKTQYDRVRQNINDDRVLQNLQFERNNSPFSGQTDYAQRGINTERERSDREMNQDFATRQSNVTQGLADLENSINAKYKALQDTSGADRERLIQSITQDERQYELAMRGEARSDILANGQLYNDEFTRALQGFQTNRGVFESDRDFGYGQYRDNVNWTGNIPGGGGYGAQSFGAQGSQGGQAPQGQRTLAGQQLDRGIYESDRNYDRSVTESDRGYGRDVFESDRDFGYQEARDKIADTRYKLEFDEDVRRNGLEYAVKKAQESRMLENTRADNARMAAGRSSGGSRGGSSGGSSAKAPKYDATPEWASEISEINAGDTTYDDLLKNSQLYIEAYSYSGYQKLLSAAKAQMK